MKSSQILGQGLNWHYSTLIEDIHSMIQPSRFSSIEGSPDYPLPGYVIPQGRVGLELLPVINVNSESWVMTI